MTRDEVIQDIVKECKDRGLSLPEQIAYVLATADHETGRTFKPVEEAFYLGDRADAYRRKLKYYPYYGRGYVQLTWIANYDKIGRIVGLPLVKAPDLALRHDVAKVALVHGMKTGLYGRPLTDYVRAGKCDFIGARRSVNGVDRAEHIARLASSYLRQGYA